MQPAGLCTHTHHKHKKLKGKLLKTKLNTGISERLLNWCCFTCAEQDLLQYKIQLWYALIYILRPSSLRVKGLDTFRRNLTKCVCQEWEHASDSRKRKLISMSFFRKRASVQSLAVLKQHKILSVSISFGKWSAKDS